MNTTKPRDSFTGFFHAIIKPQATSHDYALNYAETLKNEDQRPRVWEKFLNAGTIFLCLKGDVYSWSKGF